MRRRVVVTGVGVVSPLGNDVPTYWSNLLAGASGVSFITQFSTDKLRSDICAQVTDFEPTRCLSRKEAEIYGRVTHFQLAAAVEAVASAGLIGFLKEETPGAEQLRVLDPSRGTHEGVDRTRVGCLVSTGQGAVDIFEQQIAKSRERGPRAVSPFFIPGVMPNSGTALIAMRFGFMGPSYNLASACATGNHSIATSTMMIEAGVADVMLAGGAEAATRRNTVAGFGNARALTKARDGDPTTASRPFDADRRGFVMGEGAGVLVLEEEEHARARGATALAYVSGYGMSTDAQHLTAPHTEGLGVRVASERALAHAGITPADVGYINPHMTSTPKGDIAEIKALEHVFGDCLANIPMSATKSMVGHTLGGAGGLESIAVVCSLRDQKLHPSINIDNLDPELGNIDVVRGGPRDADVTHAMKVSAGFGGHNCVLVFSRV